MSRYFTLLVFGVMVFFPTAMAHAQCSESLLNLSICSLKECQARQSKVHPTCDVPRTCNPAKSGRLAKEELLRRLTLNQNCKMARQSVSECFKEPHGTHTQEMQKAQVGIDECTYQAGQAR